MIRSFVLLLAVVAYVNADIYLHNPRGSNDRNCERNDNRQNANRLFDSQNNAAGGYACPRAVGGPETVTPRIYYYQGSILTVEWTNQHGCGDNPRVSCDVIVQYTCSAELRDGTPNDVNDAATDTVPDDEQKSKDQRYGLHESYSYYQDCKARQRNMGLYTADQNINLKGAIATRQNNNGNRYGFECPEESEYYPYWHPSPWKDIAVLTTEGSRCAHYRSASQNVVNKGSCERKVGDGDGANPNNKGSCERKVGDGDGANPNNKDACEKAGRKWTETGAWNIPAPECIAGNEYFSRSNHLGNIEGGNAMRYNWTVPADFNDNCVLRVRYNISSLDNQDSQGLFGQKFIDAAAASQVYKLMLVDTLTKQNISEIGNGAILNLRGNVGIVAYTNPPVGLSVKFTLSGVKSLQRTDTTAPYSLFSDSGYDAIQGFGGNAVVGNYKLLVEPFANSDNPGQKVEINFSFAKGVTDSFGGPAIKTPVDVAPYKDIRGDPYPILGPDKSKFYALEVNTNQYGRTFQDRSYAFSIKPRPQGSEGQQIYNLNVRGKRGNIVQVYPSVEYDFVPSDLTVKQGDLVHIQWTGSDYNPRRGPNDGVGGPPDRADNNPNNNARTDRSNLVVMNKLGENFPGSAASQTLFVDDNGMPDWNLIYKLSHIGQTGCKTYEDLLKLNAGNARDNDVGNCARLSAAKTPYFDAGLVQIKAKPGKYDYYCTRNTNFSNRDQKGSINVKSPSTIVPHKTVPFGPLGGEYTSPNPTFMFKAVPNATYYYINVWDEKGFKQGQFTASTVCISGQCAFKFPAAFQPGVYYYLIWTYGAGGYGETSKTNTFQVM